MSDALLHLEIRQIDFCYGSGWGKSQYFLKKTNKHKEKVTLLSLEANNKKINFLNSLWRGKRAQVSQKEDNKYSFYVLSYFIHFW